MMHPGSGDWAGVDDAVRFTRTTFVRLSQQPALYAERCTRMTDERRA